MVHSHRWLQCCDKQLTATVIATKRTAFVRAKADLNHYLRLRFTYTSYNPNYLEELLPKDNENIRLPFIGPVEPRSR